MLFPFQLKDFLIKTYDDEDEFCLAFVIQLYISERFR